MPFKDSYYKDPDSTPNISVEAQVEAKGPETWWMPPGVTTVDVEFHTVEAKLARTPQEPHWSVPETSEESQRGIKSAVDRIAREVHNPNREVKKNFFIQRLMRKDKDSPLSKVADMSTGKSASDYQPLFKILENDPNAAIAIKLDKGTNGLVCVDWDPPQEEATEIAGPRMMKSPTVNLEKARRREGTILGLLKNTNQLTGEPGWPAVRPIVIQTPRGLHAWYKVDLSKPDTPRALLGIKASRGPYKLRCGLTAELVANGFCIIGGQNYRVLSCPTVNEGLSTLPPIFYPASIATNAVVYEFWPIPVGQRYNTLYAMVNSRQLVGDMGRFVDFMHDHCIEGSLEVGELMSLRDHAIRMESRSKGGSKVNKELQKGALAYTDVSSGLPVSMRDLMLAVSGKATPSERLLMNEGLKQLLNSPLMGVMALRFAWKPISFLYSYAFRPRAGIGRALRFWTANLQKYIAFTDDLGWMFYNKRAGVWEPIAEGYIFKLVKDLCAEVPLLQEEVNVDFVKSVINEFKSEIRETLWATAFVGHKYTDGILVLGYPHLVRPDPELKITRVIDASASDSMVFTKATFGYLANLCADSPAGLFLLRIYLFGAQFRIGDPSHFLYLQGPPSSGKSLFVQMLKHLYGSSAVFEMPTTGGISDSFYLQGASNQNVFWVLPDADSVSVGERIMSMLKALSTSGSIRVNRKYNEPMELSHVYVIIICNDYVINTQTADAMLRRQIVLNSKGVSSERRDPNMLLALQRNTAAFNNWITSVPHHYFGILQYSHCLNALALEWDYDSVSRFLKMILGDCRIGETLSTPLATLGTHESGLGFVEPGIYDAYVTWAEKHDKTNICKLNVFKGVLREYSENVFFIPRNPETDDVFVEKRGRNKKTNIQYSRLCWHGVKYLGSGPTDPSLQDLVLNGEVLQPLVPIEVAAVTLLHPNAIDVPFTEGGSEATYCPGIPIHFKQPTDFVAALWAYAQRGVETIVEETVLLNRRNLVETLEKIRTRGELYDQFMRMSISELYKELLATIGNKESEDASYAVAREAEQSATGQNPSDTVIDLDVGELDASEFFSLTRTGETVENVVLSAQQVKLTPASVYNRLLVAAENAKKDIANGTGPKKAGLGSKGVKKYVTRDVYLKLKAYWLTPDDLYARPFMVLKGETKLNEFEAQNNKVPGRAPQLLQRAQCGFGRVILDTVVIPSARPHLEPLSQGEISRGGFNYAVSQDTPSDADSPTEDQELPTNINDLAEVSEPFGDVNSFSGSQTVSNTEQSPDPATEMFPFVQPNQKEPGVLTNKEKPQDHLDPDKPSFEVLVRAAENWIGLHGQGFVKGATEAQAFLKAYQTHTMTEAHIKKLLTELSTFGAIAKRNERPKTFDPAILEPIINAYSQGGNTQRETNKEILLKPLKALVEKRLKPMDFTVKGPDTPNSFLMSCFQHRWNLPTPITAEYWKNDLFANRLENQQLRERWAMWPDFIGTPKRLNSLLNPILEPAFQGYSLLAMVSWVASGQFTFSKKGAINRPFFAKNMTLNLFATTYEGTPTMSDPGRIAVKGATFTTMKKDFRDLIVPELLSCFAAKNNVTFFIVDIAGCHGGIQASILRSKTPFTFAAYSDGDPRSLWERIIDESAGAFNLKEHKAKLKTIYYAALNGGSVSSVESILRHFRNYPPDQEDYLKEFARSFMRHPLYKDLGEIGAFWRSLRGEIYVPTRVDPVTRKFTEEELAKSAEKASQTEQKGSNYRVGDPKPHQMPTLLYTSLEFIFIFEVIRFVYAYFGYDENRISIVQGIHDGVLFVAEGHVNLESLEESVNKNLNPISSDALGGVALKVNVTDCTSNTNWLEVLRGETPEE
jgi:Family of unknown function (DUF5906)